MCDWKAETGDPCRCRVPALPGSSLCIFHSPDEGKDVEEFRRRLYEQLDEVGSKELRNMRFDFTGYVFPVRVVCQDDRDAGENLVLPLQLESITLHEATFGGGADFDEAMFKGSTNFCEATSKGPVGFGRATFEGHAYFGKATFKGLADFGWATFRRIAGFMDATFEGDALFAAATFEGIALFMEATFKGSASFGWARFEGGADFGVATFEGIAFFMDATFKESTNFSWATFQVYADFNRATFKGFASFGRVTFEGHADFELAEARNVSLGKRLPRINALFGNELGLRRMSREAGPSFWSFARRAFEKQGERERADAAYYLERVWRRWAAIRGDRRDRIEGWFSYPVDLLLRWSIAYGTSFQRTIMSWLVVIFGFGVVYAGFPHVLGRQPDCIWTLSNWASGIFASGSCFAKLSLASQGSITAVGKALLLCESIIGSILVALTVAVITRKVMR